MMEVAVDKATIAQVCGALHEPLWDYTATRDEIFELEPEVRRGRDSLDTAQAKTHKAQADYNEPEKLVWRLQRKSAKLKAKIVQKRSVIATKNVWITQMTQDNDRYANEAVNATDDLRATMNAKIAGKTRRFAVWRSSYRSRSGLIDSRSICRFVQARLEHPPWLPWNHGESFASII